MHTVVCVIIGGNYELKIEIDCENIIQKVENDLKEAVQDFSTLSA